MLKVDLNKQYLEEAEGDVRKKVITEQLNGQGTPLLKLEQLELNIGRKSCTEAFSKIKDITMRHLG